jgi:hypothetical protein
LIQTTIKARFSKAPFVAVALEVRVRELFICCLCKARGKSIYADASSKKSAAGLWGKAGRARPGLGTGRGGDVTEPRISLFSASLQ